MRVVKCVCVFIRRAFPVVVVARGWDLKNQEGMYVVCVYVCTDKKEFWISTCFELRLITTNRFVVCLYCPSSGMEDEDSS